MNMITREQCIYWIAALRSGEYQQGYGRLKRSEENGDEYYCCLGVVQELCELKTEGLFILPEDFIPRVEQSVFTQLNDSGRKTFLEIADHIERNFLQTLRH
jgi:hypothetical protein